MSRFSPYDTDEARLPEGMTRVGYDADTQVYTFADQDGTYWESAPGNEFGVLNRVGGEEHNDAVDSDAFLTRGAREVPSWRRDMRPLLNFGGIIAAFLLLLFWWLGRSTRSAVEVPELQCPVGADGYKIQVGDTCWAIAEARGIQVDDILSLNKDIDCEKLAIGSKICLPMAKTPS